MCSSIYCLVRLKNVGPNDQRTFYRGITLGCHLFNCKKVPVRHPLHERLPAYRNPVQDNWEVEKRVFMLCSDYINMWNSTCIYFTAVVGLFKHSTDVGSSNLWVESSTFLGRRGIRSTKFGRRNYCSTFRAQACSTWLVYLVVVGLGFLYGCWPICSRFSPTTMCDSHSS